ncbi:MAG: TonB-dependent receptor, partial [Pseudomonadota bacterium]
FHNTITDLIDRQRRSYPQYRNIEEATIMGIEVEAAYDSDNWFASLGFAYTQGENNTTNQPLTTVAPPELTTNLGYRFVDYGLTFGWNGRFVFDETRNPLPTLGRFVTQANIDEAALQKQGFHTHDLYLTWRPDEESMFHGWEANARVENVFDRRYQDFLAEDPAMGRTFRVSLTREFGV